MFAGSPGIQAPAQEGVHGMGMGTPVAAVLAATMGLAGDWHMPNGCTFTNGLQSAIFAARAGVSTTKGLGASPIVHLNTAPCLTGGMVDILGSSDGAIVNARRTDCQGTVPLHTTLAAAA